MKAILVIVAITVIISCGGMSQRTSSSGELTTLILSPENQAQEAERRSARLPIATTRKLTAAERYEPSNGFILLQPEGIGFYHYEGSDHPYTDAWGQPSTISCVEKLGKAWAQRFPERARIGVGDISRRRGGRFRPHHAHREGLDIDIRPISADGEKKVSIAQNTYEKEQTADLIALTLETCDVNLVYFNDRDIIRNHPEVRYFRGHHNHFHVALKPAAPAAKTTTEPPSVSTPKTLPDKAPTQLH